MGDRSRLIRFQTPAAVNNPSRNRAPPHVHSYSGSPVVGRPIPTRTSQATAAASIPLSSLINVTGDAIFTNMHEDGVAILGAASPSPSMPMPSPRNHSSSRPALPHDIYQRRERTHHTLPVLVPPPPAMPATPQRNRITPNSHSHRFIHQPREEVAVIEDVFIWGSNGAHQYHMHFTQVSVPTVRHQALPPHFSRTGTNYTTPLPHSGDQRRVDGHHGDVHSYLEEEEEEEDISYEALLELGEELGTVRVLSEEDISTHLNVEAASSSMESDLCVICQDPIEVEQAIAVLQCNHNYHAHCIKKWLLEKNVCPVCKRTGIVV